MSVPKDEKRSVILHVQEAVFEREGKYFLNLKTFGEEKRTDVNEEASKVAKFEHGMHSWSIASGTEIDSIEIGIVATQLAFSKGAQAIGSASIKIASIHPKPKPGGKPVPYKCLIMSHDRRNPSVVATLKVTVEIEDEAAKEQARREKEDRERREAEERARAEMEEAARREEAERLRLESEERLRREAESRARKQAEERSRREAEERARKEEEARLQREKEERARRDAEEEARREAEEHARREAEECVRREADERARRAAEERARREAEQQARVEAAERAMLEAEERAKREASERERQQAAALARLETEARARRDAEEHRRRQEEEVRTSASHKASLCARDAPHTLSLPWHPPRSLRTRQCWRHSHSR